MQGTNSPQCTLYTDTMSNQVVIQIALLFYGDCFCRKLTVKSNSPWNLFVRLDVLTRFPVFHLCSSHVPTGLFNADISGFPGNSHILPHVLSFEVALEKRVACNISQSRILKSGFPSISNSWRKSPCSLIMCLAVKIERSVVCKSRKQDYRIMNFIATRTQC